MIAASETSIIAAPTKTPAINANGTGTPTYPKNRKHNVMQPRTTGELTGGFSSTWRLDGGHGARLFRRLRVIEAVAAAVDQLLDGKQENQYAGHGGRRVERRYRGHRGEPVAAKTPQIVAIPEVDETGGDHEDNHTNDDLHDQPRRAVQRVGKRRQVEVIIAPGCNRGADEDAVDEKPRRDFLEPEPGKTDRARDDVACDRNGEAEQRDTAQDHQDQLEPIKRSPLEVTLPVQHQFVGDAHGSRLDRLRAEAGRRPLVFGRSVDGSNQRLYLVCVGAKLLGELVEVGIGDCLGA